MPTAIYIDPDIRNQFSQCARIQKMATAKTEATEHVGRVMVNDNWVMFGTDGKSMVAYTVGPAPLRMGLEDQLDALGVKDREAALGHLIRSHLLPSPGMTKIELELQRLVRWAGEPEFDYVGLCSPCGGNGEVLHPTKAGEGVACKECNGTGISPTNSPQRPGYLMGGTVIDRVLLARVLYGPVDRDRVLVKGTGEPFTPVFLSTGKWCAVIAAMKPEADHDPLPVFGEPVPYGGLIPVREGAW